MQRSWDTMQLRALLFYITFLVSQSFGFVRHIPQLVREVGTKLFTKGNVLMSGESSIKGLDLQFEEIFTERTRIKCYALSDLHADTEKNQIKMRDLCKRKAEDKDAYTVFILPGDVGSEMNQLEKVFRHLVANYDLVCFVPGNHELWRRGVHNIKGTSVANQGEGSASSINGRSLETMEPTRVASDSIEKMTLVLECALSCGVRVGPVRVAGGGEDNGVVVVPLYSWYHAGWDREPDITHPDYKAVEEVMPFARKWGDFAFCSWPAYMNVLQTKFASTSQDNRELAMAFADLNEPFLKRAEATPESLPLATGRRRTDTVISFSHFLPRQELIPEKRFMLEPQLAKVSGSDPLEEQVRRLQPDLHLFGHTHIPIDLTLDGIRYIQWPMGYAKESERVCKLVHSVGPLLVHDSAIPKEAPAPTIADPVINEHTTNPNSSLNNLRMPQNSPSLLAAWSLHYQLERRTPEIVDALAPWVLMRLESFGGLVRSNQKRASSAVENRSI